LTINALTKVLPAAALLAAHTHARALEFFGSQSTGPSFGLVKFDAPLSGTSARIGTNGGAGDMDFDSAGVLYAPDFGQLSTINLSTGIKSRVGPWMAQGANMQSISFAPDGTLYAIDYSPSGSRLYRVNKSNAVLTLVGAIGTPVQAIEFAPDGTLYGGGLEVFKINTTTGAKGATVLTGFSAGHIVTGLDYGADGVWRACIGEGNLTTPDTLYQLDLAAGTAALIGTSNETDLRALASVPAPSTAAGALALTAWLGRRRRVV